MNCPHCKKEISEIHIRISNLIEQLEVDPWLLHEPTLVLLWDKLRKWIEEENN